jgi:hypothetical protein
MGSLDPIARDDRPSERLRARPSPAYAGNEGKEDSQDT